MFRAAFLTFAALATTTAVTPSHAAVIAQNNVGFDIPGGDNYYYGQSFTVEGTGGFNNVAMTFFTGYGASIPYALGKLFLYSSPFAGTVSQLGTGSNFLASTTGANDAFSFGSSLIVEGGTKYYAYLDGETPPLQFGRSNAYAGGTLLEAGRGTGFQFREFSSLDFRFGIAGSSMLSAVPEPASWAMMLIGFGVIGGAMRSRRQPTASFA